MKKISVLSFVIVIGLSLTLGACAPLRSAQEAVMEEPAMAPPAADFYEEEMVYDKEMAEGEREFSSGVGDANAATDRMVIYNAFMEIAVESPEASMQSIIKMVETGGGFVVSSNLSRTYTTSGSLPYASLTVRVPAGQLDSIMEAIKALTPNPEEDVISENVSGQDVTAEFTDLESRLRNLEAAEEALVKLMEEAQDPEDVLNIFDELTYYRGEIEIVKGRMKYIEESVALSSINVEIRAKKSLQPIEIIGWQPKGTVKKAVETLIQAGQFLADALIWFGIFCLPFLIPLSIGVYFLVKLIRKRRANRKAKKALEAEGLEVEALDVEEIEIEKVEPEV